MKKFLFLFAISFLAIGFAKSQNKIEWLYSNDIEKLLKNDTTHFKMLIAQKQFNLIGDYANSLKYADMIKIKVDSEKPLNWLEHFTNPKDFKTVSAKDYLVEKLKNEKIIVIAEEKYNPLARVFFATIMKDLYVSGFKYFSHQYLYTNDSTIAKYKYPTQNTYTIPDELHLGNLIREALSNGFSIFPLETDKSYLQQIDKNNERANIIKSVFDMDPNAKIVIFMNIQDGFKGNDANNVKGVLDLVKDKTGITAFTINTAALYEHHFKSLENSNYSKIKAEEPSFLVDKSEKLLGAKNGNMVYDAVLYFPKSKYEDGRPNWLKQKESKFTYFINANKISVNYPVLVKAFKINEEKGELLPYDVIELKSATDKKALLLKNGEYYFEAINKNGDKNTFQK